MEILILQMWSEVPMWARFLAPVLYAAIGYRIAILSFEAYDTRNKPSAGGDGSVMDSSKIILFPVAVMTHGVRFTTYDVGLGILSVVRGNRKSEVLYVVLHMIAWLPRLACNLGIVVCLVFLSLFVLFGFILGSLVADLVSVAILFFKTIPPAPQTPTE